MPVARRVGAVSRSLPAEAGVADIVAATWSACLRHWRPLLLTALPGALLAGFTEFGLLRSQPAPAAGGGTDAESAPTLLVAALPYLLGALVGQVFTHLALVRLALGLVRDERVGVAAAWATGLRRLAPGVVAMFVISLALALLAATLILAPLALYLGVGWILTAQVLIDEEYGAFAALGRSRRLVSGQWWRACTVGLSVLVLSFLPGLVLAQVGAATGSELGAIITAALAALLAAPFLAMGHTMLYLEIRRRKGEPLRPAPGTHPDPI
jgi:hypothetical protein